METYLEDHFIDTTVVRMHVRQECQAEESGPVRSSSSMQRVGDGRACQVLEAAVRYGRLDLRKKAMRGGLSPFSTPP